MYQSGRAGPGPDGNTCDWSSATGPHDQVTAVCISQVELALDLMIIPVAGLQRQVSGIHSCFGKLSTLSKYIAGVIVKRYWL